MRGREDSGPRPLLGFRGLAFIWVRRSVHLTQFSAIHRFVQRFAVSDVNEFRAHGKARQRRKRSFFLLQVKAAERRLDKFAHGAAFAGSLVHQLLMKRVGDVQHDLHGQAIESIIARSNRFDQIALVAPIRTLSVCDLREIALVELSSLHAAAIAEV